MPTLGFGQRSILALAIDAASHGRRRTGRHRDLRAAGAIHIRCVRKIRLERVCNAVPKRSIRAAVLTQIDGRNRHAFAASRAAETVLLQHRRALRRIGLNAHLTSRAPVIDADRATGIGGLFEMAARSTRDLRTGGAGRFAGCAARPRRQHRDRASGTIGGRTIDVVARSVAARPGARGSRAASTHARRAAAAAAAAAAARADWVILALGSGLIAAAAGDQERSA